jgi:hypothetical protein
VFRPPVLLILSLATLSGCSKQGSPEQVADGFVQAYFQRADQEKAKEFTALGATEMLDREIKEVAPLRKEGYTPSDESARVTYRRGAAIPRDQRIRFPYEIVVKSDAGESIRDADVELTSINGTWKVVRVGLKSR